MAEEIGIEQQQHPDYIKELPRWTRIRDAIDGSDAIKDKTHIYLPKPEAMSADRYQVYLNRAQWYDVSDRTQQGLRGAMFTREPTVEVPPVMEPQIDRMSMRGLKFLGLARRIAGEILALGRFGVLLDRGESEDSINVLPKVATYVAETITDWSSEKRDGEWTLTRVVLREPEDGDDRSGKHQFRELVLDPDGRYVVRIWKKNETSGKFEVGPDVFPTIGAQRMDFIPFVFFGAVDLDPAAKKPPLLPLVDANIGHYQLSADLRQALFLTGQPTPWAAGAREGEVPMALGSGELWLFEDSDAKVGLLEYEGQGVGAIRQEMQDTEHRMVLLGARFFEASKQGVEAADAVRLKHAGDSATLTSIALTVGEGLTRVLQWAAQMARISAPEDAISVQMSMDFLAVPMTPQEIEAALKAWQQGAIAYKDLFTLLQRGDVIAEERTEEDVKGEIETEAPTIPPSPPVEDEPDVIPSAAE